VLRLKAYEPILVCVRAASTTQGGNPFEGVDIRVKVTGGGHTSQIYAVRQALARAVVAYTAKYADAATALELRKTLISYDRTLLISDPRRCEPKKFGGPGTLARFSLELVVEQVCRCSCQIPEVVRWTFSCWEAT
jgi:small subunit ribosomal protein S16e